MWKILVLAEEGKYKMIYFNLGAVFLLLKILANKAKKNKLT